jgi:DNA-binding transcriptional ArsR family regulator
MTIPLIAVVDRPAQAASLLKPLRARILEHLCEPDSATGVAAALGLPRQRVGYHVRQLEQLGLVGHVGDRRRGNFIERLLVAAARYFVIAPAALGRLGAHPDEVSDRFSSDYLVAVAAQTAREVAALGEVARTAGNRAATTTLQVDIRFSSPEEQGRCADEIARFVADLARRYHRPTTAESRSVRFLVAGYATPWPPARSGTSGTGAAS